MGVVLSVHDLRNILAPYNSITVCFGSRSLSSIHIHADKLQVYSKTQKSLMMYQVYSAMKEQVKIPVCTILVSNNAIELYKRIGEPNTKLIQGIQKTRTRYLLS